MKSLLLFLIIFPLNALPFDSCDPHEFMCKKVACSSTVFKSLNAVTSTSCTKHLKRAYKDDSEWEFMFYELEVISTTGKGIAADTFGQIIRLKDIK